MKNSTAFDEGKVLSDPIFAKKTKSTPRAAQLMAEAVSVCCPFCGAPQPNAEGSEMWIPQDFIKKNGRHSCVACDAKIAITAGSKAQFR